MFLKDFCAFVILCVYMCVCVWVRALVYTCLYLCSLSRVALQKTSVLYGWFWSIVMVIYICDCIWKVFFGHTVLVTKDMVCTVWWCVWRVLVCTKGTDVPPECADVYNRCQMCTKCGGVYKVWWCVWRVLVCTKGTDVPPKGAGVYKVWWCVWRVLVCTKGTDVPPKGAGVYKVWWCVWRVLVCTKGTDVPLKCAGVYSRCQMCTKCAAVYQVCWYVQGTLLKHLEEHVVQGNMTRDDIMLYYTTVSCLHDICHFVCCYCHVLHLLFLDLWWHLWLVVLYMLILG